MPLGAPGFDAPWQRGGSAPSENFLHANDTVDICIRFNDVHALVSLPARVRRLSPVDQVFNRTVAVTCNLRDKLSTVPRSA
jgi:hypothetical protein